MKYYNLKLLEDLRNTTQITKTELQAQLEKLPENQPLVEIYTEVITKLLARTAKSSFAPDELLKSVNQILAQKGLIYTRAEHLVKHCTAPDLRRHPAQTANLKNKIIGIYDLTTEPRATPNYPYHKLIEWDPVVFTQVERRLKIAAAAPDPEPEKVAAELDKLEELVRRASTQEEYTPAGTLLCQCGPGEVFLTHINDYNAVPRYCLPHGSNLPPLQYKPRAYAGLVQEALAYALQYPGRKIMFATSYAMEAMGRARERKFVPKTLVTAKNYAQLLARQRQARRRYDQLRVGAPIKLKDFNRAKMLIVRRTATEIMATSRGHTYLIPVLFSLVQENNYFRPHITAQKVSADLAKNLHTGQFEVQRVDSTGGTTGGKIMPGGVFPRVAHGEHYRFWIHPRRLQDLEGFLPREIYQQTLVETPEREKIRTHYSFYYVALHAMDQQDTEGVLDALDNMFEYVVELDRQTARAEKIKYLEQEIMPSLDQRRRPRNTAYLDHYRLFNKFLIKFNYHQALLARFPHVKQIRRGRKLLFITEPCTLWPVRPPEAIKINTLVDSEGSEVRAYRTNQDEPYQHYDRELPALLTKLKIDYRQTVVYYAPRPETAPTECWPVPMWEITTPSKELRTRSKIII